MTDIFIVYDDKSQIKRIEDALGVSSIFHFIDSMSKHGKKEAAVLKSHWAARLNPFVLIMDGEKAIKAFYSETGEDVIESLIDYLNEQNIYS